MMAPPRNDHTTILPPEMVMRRHECDQAGISVTVMPPGHLKIDWTIPTLSLNFGSPQGADMPMHRIDGTDYPTYSARPGGYDVAAPGGKMEADATNHGWECLVELQQNRIEALAPEMLGRPFVMPDALVGGHDPTLASLSAMVVQHLRLDRPDRLFVEGIGLALTARVLSQIAGDRDVSAAGTNGRIARAADFIEANLAEPLEVAAIASVAGMSPSWFASAFKSQTGQAVHAYVRERRLERARTLLMDGRMPIKEIAYATGFADQSHLTRAFRRRFGTTPGRVR